MVGVGLKEAVGTGVVLGVGLGIEIKETDRDWGMVYG